MTSFIPFGYNMAAVSPASRLLSKQEEEKKEIGKETKAVFFPVKLGLSI